MKIVILKVENFAPTMCYLNMEFNTPEEVLEWLHTNLGYQKPEARLRFFNEKKKFITKDLLENEFLELQNHVDVLYVYDKETWKIIPIKRVMQKFFGDKYKD